MKNVKIFGAKFFVVSLILLSILTSHATVNAQILAHITADKPCYQPGDMAFIEVFTFNSVTKAPYARTPGYQAKMTILDEGREEVYSDTNDYYKHGSFSFTYKIPNVEKEGEYQVKVSSKDFPTSYRAFLIKPHANSDVFVTFDADASAGAGAYNAEAGLQAKVKVRMRGEPKKLPYGSRISYTVDDFPDRSGEKLLNGQGEAEVEFTVPRTSEGQIMINISTYLGELSKKPYVSKFPIAVKKTYTKGLETIFYSEFGGTGKNLGLVAGVKNRVYFEVVQKDDPKKLVEIEQPKLDGRLIETVGSAVRNGRSFFDFVPSNTERVHKLRFTYGENDYDDWVPAADPERFIQVAIGKGQGSTQTSIVDPAQEYLLLHILSNTQQTDAIDLEVSIRNLKEVIYKSPQKISVQYTSQGVAGTQCVDDYPYQASERNYLCTLVRIPISGEAAFQKSSPNGGVLVLKIQGIGYTFERLIFMKPKPIEFTIDLATDGQPISYYMPGDKVNIVAKLTQPPAAGEEYAASVFVSDLSSVQNPSQYVMPSLDSMVYFEKEIKQINDQLDIFPDSQVLEGSNEVIDLILAIQDWRRGKLDDLEQIIDEMQVGNERLRFEYLSSEKKAFYFDNSVQILNKVSQKGKGLQLDLEADEETSWVSGSSQNPFAPNQSDELEYSKLLEKNTRSWSHERSLSGQDKTQTLLYHPAEEITQLGAGLGFGLSQAFHLNDQVSSFRVTVAMFTNKGKISAQSRIFETRAYVKGDLELPNSMYPGDNIKYQLTITNHLCAANQLCDLTDVGYSLQQIEYRADGTLVYPIPKQQIVYTDQTGVQQVSYNDFSSQGSGIRVQSNAAFTESNVMLQVSDQEETKSQAKRIEVIFTVYYNGRVADRVSKTVKVLNIGWNRSVVQSGRIGVKDENDVKKFGDIQETVSHSINMAAYSSMTETPKWSLKVITKPLEIIMESISNMIKEPYGTEEQMISVMYPMVMSLRLVNTIQNDYEEQRDLDRIQNMKLTIMQKLKKGYDILNPDQESGLPEEYPDKTYLLSEMAKVVLFVDKKYIKEADESETQGAEPSIGDYQTCADMQKLMLKSPSENSKRIDEGMKTIMTKIGNGAGFGSSKTTVVCLEALQLYYQTFGKLQGKGNFRLSVNGIDYVKPYDGQSLSGDQLDFDFSKVVQRRWFKLQNNGWNCGENVQVDVTLTIEPEEGSAWGNGFALMYYFAADFKQYPIESEESAKLGLGFTVNAPDRSATSQYYQVNVQNLSPKAAMVVTTLAKSGCEEFINLEELKKDENVRGYQISAFHGANDNLLTIYWKDVPPETSLSINVPVRNAFQSAALVGNGKCQRQQSQAYLYQDSSEKVWTAGDASNVRECHIGKFPMLDEETCKEVGEKEMICDSIQSVEQFMQFFDAFDRSTIGIEEEGRYVWALTAAQEDALELWDANPSDSRMKEEDYSYIEANKSSLVWTALVILAICGFMSCFGYVCKTNTNFHKYTGAKPAYLYDYNQQPASPLATAKQQSSDTRPKPQQLKASKPVSLNEEGSGGGGNASQVPGNRLGQASKAASPTMDAPGNNRAGYDEENGRHQLDDAGQLKGQANIGQQPPEDLRMVGQAAPSPTALRLPAAAGGDPPREASMISHGASDMGVDEDPAAVQVQGRVMPESAPKSNVLSGNQAKGGISGAMSSGNLAIAKGNMVAKAAPQ